MAENTSKDTAKTGTNVGTGIQNPESLINAPQAVVNAANADNKETPELKQTAADKAFNEEVEKATREEKIKREVALRMAQSGTTEGAIDTANPYGIKPGEKVGYMVGGQLVDADGQVIAKKD